MARFWLVPALALVACGGSRSGSGPIELVDDTGHRTALARPAARIVSLVPATTEALFALGAGDRLVGRTRWCDYPPAAAALPSVGDGMQPNVEAILARAPDLVVAYRSIGNRAAVNRLRALGVPTLELGVDQLVDFARAVRLLAHAVGRPAAGDTLIARLERELDVATVRRDRPPTVLLLSWHQPPIALGGGTFLSEIVERAGFRNLFDDEPKPSFVVNIEAVASRDPDWVLVTGEGDPDWAGRPEWQAVRAVRERRFLRVSGSEYNRPSPRAPLAVARLAALGTR